jgi:hypothetical protein
MLDVFGVHQVGVLVRQLVQNMQVLRANRLSKGGSHRPSMLTCLLFAAPSALFGSHAAVELLTVEPLVAPRSLTAPRPSSGGNARLDLRLLRPTFVRALARSRDLPSPRAQEYQSEPIPAPPRRSDLYSSASPSRPSAATDGYHPSAQDQKHGLSSLPGGSKSVLNAPRQRLTRQADGEPT